MDYSAWVSEAIKKRGWSQRELARRASLSQASVSKTINGERNPTADICVRIALALGESPEKLLRIAGILPPTVGDDSTIQELIDVARQLSPELRKEVLAFARFKLQND